jgi:ribonuclease HI
MIVTINTDASFHPKHKIGGYAFWIVCDEGRFSHSGILRKEVNRPEVAEMKCIINAIYVLGTLNFKNISKIIINTDCLNAIHLFKKRKSSIKKYELEWGLDLANDLTNELAKSKLSKTLIEFRHIRSHQHTETKRNWVNNWCDKAAKKQLWGKINSVKKIK